MLAEHEKIVVEGAGATGLAALLQHGTKFKNKKVGIVICGVILTLKYYLQF